MPSAWSPAVRIEYDVLHVDDLKISFRRTLRVPGNRQSSALPPSFGNFPLLKVNEYLSKLPAEMGAKGGLFFPMYQREAMWVNFEASKPYAIKIYVGGVNAVSGEPSHENAATILRRRTKVRRNESIQDYITVPDQHWIDGIASEEGKVRQFVAMPLGSGYTVEKQITGEDVVGGLQFEITPLAEYHITIIVQEKHGDRSVTITTSNKATLGELKSKIVSESQWDLREDRVLLEFKISVLRGDAGTVEELDIKEGDTLYILWSSFHDSSEMRSRDRQEVYVVTATGHEFVLYVKSTQTIENVKYLIQDAKSIPVDYQSLIFAGTLLDDERLVADYNIRKVEEESTLYLVIRLRGGGGGEPRQMGIAAGGRIKQTIVRDTSTRKWDPSQTVVFNVQILNTAHFRAVTGRVPPEPPIDAGTYAAMGYPFFTIYEEPSTVIGDFTGVRSVGEIDMISEPSLAPQIVSLGTASSYFFNSGGPMNKFRTVEELEREVAARGKTLF